MIPFLPHGLDYVLILAVMGLLEMYLVYRMIRAAQVASRAAMWWYLISILALAILMIVVAYFGLQSHPTHPTI